MTTPRYKPGDRVAWRDIGLRFGTIVKVARVSLLAVALAACSPDPTPPMCNIAAEYSPDLWFKVHLVTQCDGPDWQLEYGIHGAGFDFDSVRRDPCGVSDDFRGLVTAPVDLLVYANLYRTDSNDAQCWQRFSVGGTP